MSQGLCIIGESHIGEATSLVMLNEVKHLGNGERPTLRFFATLQNDNAKALAMSILHLHYLTKLMYAAFCRALPLGRTFIDEKLSYSRRQLFWGISRVAKKPLGRNDTNFIKLTNSERLL